MQFPLARSLSGTLTPLAVGLSAVLRATSGETFSSSEESDPSFAAAVSCFFFRPNTSGKGWLIDLPWPLLPLVWVVAANVGMPYAFSSISASVILVDRPGVDALVFALAGVVLWSLRALGLSSLLVHGAMAKLSIIIVCSLQVTQSL